ncbi:MAG: thermosome subunit [Methanobacteriota archaeon]|nr:MAG: thermosome subunit [Euryarchaeota archaeon]
MTLTGQPVIILKEGTTRTRGKDALRNNIQAAKVIAEAVKSSLGPKGMDKMLVDNFGDVVITNDGATILKEIDIQHPGAKFVVELAKTQDQEVGDGTTSVVVLAGELLKRAEDLLDQNIHPSVIVEGYKLARQKSLELLRNNAIQIKEDDREALINIAKTSMSSKIVKVENDHLAKIIVDAVLKVATKKDGESKVDLDDIVIVKKIGNSLRETELVDGLVVDKEFVHPDMPTVIKNAKVLVINKALEITKTEFDAKLSISTPEEVQKFLERERAMLKEMADKIIKSGANVVFAQKGIDDTIQHFLADANISAVRRVKKSDIERISEITGATIVTNLEDLDESYLGTAKLVEQKNIAGDDLIFISGTPNSSVVTILIRGGTEFVLDEYERSIHDALSVVRNIIEDKALVPGGGAIELMLSRALNEYADTQPSKIQLAIRAFAQALLVIPKTLAENAGLDPIEMIGEMNNYFAENKTSYGINPFSGKVEDMSALGVLEPSRVKDQAISSAAEAATILLRIDDIVSAKDLGGGDNNAPPGGGMDDDF